MGSMLPYIAYTDPMGMMIHFFYFCHYMREFSDRPISCVIYRPNKSWWRCPGCHLDRNWGLKLEKEGIKLSRQETPNSVGVWEDNV